MSSIRGLASQTMIYGVSTILGRLLNYMLVPLYSRVFLPEESYAYTEMYAYVAFFIVLLTYGMETAFFRFSESEDDKQKVFTTTIISILTTSTIFITLMFFMAQDIATFLQYANNPEYITYFALIVGLDAFISIPFAKLRAGKRPVKFAAIQVTQISVNIGLNSILLLLFPYVYSKFPSWQPYLSWIGDGKPQISFIFIANLAATLVAFILLLPEWITIKLKFDFKLWKRMMRYALPLLILGMAGIANETIDRVLLKYLLPEAIWKHELGVYGMCFKVAIVMSVFIQAFRYAAEPFFFSKYKEHDARETYADIMKYFVIILAGMFLTIMLYMDIVKYFVGKEYYEGLKIVPVLLYSHLFLGIFYNLSIWYKLTGQTRFGAYISITGTIITISINITLIPVMGYMGSAWANFICYTTMAVLSYILGQKYYKIPYNIKKILLYMGLSAGIWALSTLFHIEEKGFRLAVNTLLLLVFILIVYWSEPKLRRLFSH